MKDTTQLVTFMTPRVSHTPFVVWDTTALVSHTPFFVSDTTPRVFHTPFVVSDTTALVFHTPFVVSDTTWGVWLMTGMVWHTQKLLSVPVAATSGPDPGP